MSLSSRLASAAVFTALAVGPLGCSAHAPLSPALTTQTYDASGGVVVELQVEPFDPASHTLDVGDGAGTANDSIDGQPAYGMDGHWPSRRVVRATLTLPDGKRLPLDVHGMFDPDLTGSDSPPFHIERNGPPGSYLLKGWFSDGAGSYQAEWMVRGDRTSRTSIVADCNASRGDLDDPSTSQLKGDLPPEYSGCRIESAVPWTYQRGEVGMELDMIVHLRCNSREEQIVSRYAGDGKPWISFPRPDPFRRLAEEQEKGTH